MRLGASSDDSHRIGVRERTREAGTAVVEFALIVPLLLLIVFGILDFGRALNYLNDATHLSATGARYAIVNRNPGADAGVSLQQWIQSQGDTGEMRNNSHVCITFMTENPQPGDPVEVTVEVDFGWLGFLDSQIPGLPDTLEGSATMRLEQPVGAAPAYSEGCYPA